jgi:hypothetical protein
MLTLAVIMGGASLILVIAHIFDFFENKNLEKTNSLTKKKGGPVKYWHVVYIFEKGFLVGGSGSIQMEIEGFNFFPIKYATEYIKNIDPTIDKLIINNWIELTEEQYLETLSQDGEE